MIDPESEYQVETIERVPVAYDVFDPKDGEVILGWQWEGDFYYDETLKEIMDYPIVLGSRRVSDGPES
jgi:hypothetical protein